MRRTVHTCFAALSPLVLVLFLASCSGSDPVAPSEKKPTVRLYNTMVPSKPARLNIAGTTYGSTVASGAQGPRLDLAASYENAEVVIDNGQSSTVHARTTGSFPASSSSSVIVFPANSMFEPRRMPDSVVIVRDSGTVAAGKCRFRVINAADACTPSTGELSVYLGDALLLGSSELTLRAVSRWVTVEPGDHAMRVVRQWQIPYEAATRTVTFVAGASYTLLLTGTLDLGDSWSFKPVLLSDGVGQSPVEFLIPPDVGNFQIVNAVTGVRSFDVRIDGKTPPSMAQVAFPNATGYVELDLGTHTVEVVANGTPLVNNVRTLATLRSRKTMFVTGTLVPPNIVGMELSEPERAQDPTQTSVRVINLSPDSPLLDVALLRDTTELQPEGWRSLEFRESSSVPGTTNQFITIAPGRYRLVAYRAGTKTAILPPTDITLEPGQVRTLWVGGLVSSIGLHSVIHAK
jgi:hypothetical protein